MKNSFVASELSDKTRVKEYLKIEEGKSARTYS